MPRAVYFTYSQATRVSTTDQDPQLQLDALNAEGCLKIYKDTATGTKADRPQWTLCLDDHA
ncbi:recombinase family protein [Pseudarthrobacter psychrotolerans]|uniref:Recombinase family protein n=1 Tax=Pseudarthrobacter psychrotolerans TaxID=2697569 RepID=A0A6P1NE83_9MICC|nr:recombinase family protein [Pseudarthrobacter psychrotolerans]QHK18576.1 recombinase family protein [Pseudarthrobacter psychrotolerans]